MKKIEAIIRPEKILAVKGVLDELGYAGLTVHEVVGHGTQRGVIQQWQGKDFKVEFLPKLWLLLVVDDSDVEAVIAAIRERAVTGEVGDGKIFISTVDDAVRVRTGERGLKALGDVAKSAM